VLFWFDLFLIIRWWSSFSNGDYDEPYLFTSFMLFYLCFSPPLEILIFVTSVSLVSSSSSSSSKLNCSFISFFESFPDIIASELSLSDGSLLSSPGDSYLTPFVLAYSLAYCFFLKRLNTFSDYSSVPDF